MRLNHQTWHQLVLTLFACMGNAFLKKRFSVFENGKNRSMTDLKQDWNLFGAASTNCHKDEKNIEPATEMTLKNKFSNQLFKLNVFFSKRTTGFRCIHLVHHVIASISVQ